MGVRLEVFCVLSTKLWRAHTQVVAGYQFAFAHAKGVPYFGEQYSGSGRFGAVQLVGPARVMPFAVDQVDVHFVPR
jgi:hypothetical protein